MLKKILLFGLVAIMSSAIMVFSAYEGKFPRIAFSPPYIFHNGSDYNYYTYFPQAVDTLGLTALVQNLWVFRDADFASAASDSLNLINAWTAYYSYGQYSMYQADGYNEYDWFLPNIPGENIRFLSTKYNNAGHGHQISEQVGDSIGYAWFVSKDNPNDNRGYVLYGLWNERTGPNSLGPYAIDYSREQEKADRHYTATFKLKVPCSPTSEPVANIGVYFYHGADSTVWSRTLLYQDFNPCGQYLPFKLTFSPGWSSGDSFDYRVYWNKNTDLYIDYVEVYDSNYAYLFYVRSDSNPNMTVYQWNLIHDSHILDNEQFHGTSLYRWALQDQPAYDQFRSSRRVNEILDSAHYVPGIQSAGDFDYINTYRYMNEVNPHELFYDDYPIWRDTTPENDNDAWQETLDSFAVRLNKVANAAKSRNKEWWYIAQTFKSLTAPVPRYPHNSELKATVNMALAYGVKGIGYFEYASRAYAPDDVHGGLIDSVEGKPIETYPAYVNIYYSSMSIPETLFSAVKQINERLDTLGPILKKLEWRWAGPSSQVGSAPGSFIASVNGVACSTCCICICKEPTYENHIQVGMFRDDSVGEDYFMLVNRWVGYGERPCQQVTLQKSRYSYLIDCSTGQLLDTLSGNGTFHLIINPGEGKLFRLANFLKSNLSGSVIGTNPQRIRLSWTDPNRNETSYRVERKLASQSEWPLQAEIGSTNANVTSYDDTSLTGSETYNYRVRAYDGVYYSEYSNQITVRNIPNPPRNLTAHLNRICCPGRGAGAGSGIGINGICPYCYTNEIILSWQAPQNQKSGTLASYRAVAWRGTWNASQTVPFTSTTTTFCVPELGKSYNFAVYAIDSAGNVSNPSTSISISSGTTDYCYGDGEPQQKIVASVIPERFELFQNYPNPFNFGTLIKYALPQESEVKIVVYNLLGQKVRVLVNDIQEPGYYTISWNGKNERGEAVGSGIYFYRIQAGSFTKTAKMSLLK
ncbi:MAG: T9SS type A sorting domain-containing protein [candidate division Zixibacteria bacterium]|nr:T9SS type A sorting domain-containing protein [candidate division Zixibacteria bacterium]